MSGSIGNHSNLGVDWQKLHSTKRLEYVSYNLCRARADFDAYAALRRSNSLLLLAGRAHASELHLYEFKSFRVNAGKMFTPSKT